MDAFRAGCVWGVGDLRMFRNISKRKRKKVACLKTKSRRIARRGVNRITREDLETPSTHDIEVEIDKVYNAPFYALLDEDYNPFDDPFGDYLDDLMYSDERERKLLELEAELDAEIAKASDDDWWDEWGDQVFPR